MRVSLFVSCLVDQLWPAVGVSSVKLLRDHGLEVEFDERQTCCGQPAFNTGYRDEAREVASCFLDTVGRTACEAIVVPSGSCAAMIHHLPELFEGEQRERAQQVAANTFELSTFLGNHASGTGASEGSRCCFRSPRREATVGVVFISAKFS